MSQARQIAFDSLERLINKKVGLNELLSAVDDSQKALVSELCFGVCRYYFQLTALAKGLMQKPLKKKDSDVLLLLVLGLYQLRFTKLAPHAVVFETVALVDKLNKEWAKGFINACLRRYIREFNTTDKALTLSVPEQFAHPQWLFERLKKAWPDDYQSIMHQNNQRAPMSLRVNRLQYSRADYLALLDAFGVKAAISPLSNDGLILETPCPVSALPHFATGAVSVQDIAAQMAVPLLQLAKGQRVLDACAAPGGKTGHILEREPELEALVALDLEPRRLVKVKENLQRLKLSATVVAGDACCPATWWDGELFDSILLDAPCSATGVIRRHPDIKLLRSPQAVTAIAMMQAQLLDALWPLLKPGGRLVYVTCSVLPVENEQQIAAFLERTTDVNTVALSFSRGDSGFGQQLLPSEVHDGFYYAVLVKTSDSFAK